MTARVRRTKRSDMRRDQIDARGTVIQVKRSDEGSTSRQLDYADEWLSAAGVQGLIIPPPYPIGSLLRMVEESSTLAPCIEAFVVNTVGTGWEIGPVNKKTKPNKDDYEILESFRDAVNTEESLVTVLSAAVADREALGFGFIEGIRDASGRLTLLRHAPSSYTRLGHKGEHPIPVTRTIRRGRRYSSVVEYRRFRKFLQLVAGEVVYFKEWGDPRPMNRKTGIYRGEQGYAPGNDATEILHLKLKSSEPYGVPRWITQTPSVLGSREAEEVNMRYFQDNTVPPMMLTVAGGRLTEASFKQLVATLQKGHVGSDRQNRIMLIEAVGDTDSLDSKGTPVQLKVEKLTDTRQSDALFAAYDEANQKKMRMAWRIPAVLLGQGDDTNYANAQVSVFLTDSQVFDPARFEIDEVINNQIVNPEHGLGVSTCKLISRVPPISSPETLVKTLTAANVMGAVTPRIAQNILNTIMQMELEPYPEKGEEGYEDWMDKPIALSRQGDKTHVEQSLKDDNLKELEEDGDVGFKRPENGAEAETIPDV